VEVIGVERKVAARAGVDGVIDFYAELGLLDTRASLPFCLTQARY
jgi:hypothetical protein